MYLSICKIFHKAKHGHVFNWDCQGDPSDFLPVRQGRQLIHEGLLPCVHVCVHVHMCLRGFIPRLCLLWENILKLLCLNSQG